jgi:ligand-binding sensor domain-containing protein
LLRSTVLIWSLAISRHAFALDPSKTLSQYVHRTWQVQQGLPEASIYSIVQTRDGYLWLGTQTGLIRFDGARFTTVDVLGGLQMTGARITQLMEGRDGALWVGTNQAGVVEFKNGKARRYEQRDGLPSGSIQCLFADANDNVWVCTPNGVAELTGGAVHAFGSADGLPEPDVRAGCASPSGTFVAGADHARISNWNGNRFVSSPLAVPDSASVQAMLCGLARATGWCMSTAAGRIVSRSRMAWLTTRS